MKLVIQRVSKASVTIDDAKCADIRNGLLVLLGIHMDDKIENVDWFVHKLVQMRIFNDENGKMNRSVQDIQGEILIVSQFTLYGQAEKGNRPSFIQAARPEIAIPIYEDFIRKTKNILGEKRVQTGKFGADMKIELINDGPVTIIL